MLQKRKVVRGISAFGVAVLLSTISMPMASAATTATPPNNGFNFTISPPAVAVETTPGTPITVDVRIQNQNNATEKVKATLMKFVAQGDTGTPDLRSLEPTDEFGKWATISPSVFDAEPNVWQTVKLTITPPSNAAFGYYYAVVFSRDGAEKQVQNKKANLLAGLASLVLLDVKAPGAVRNVQVADFSTAAHISEFLPVNFNVKLHNVGNTHVGIQGSISISKGGKFIQQIDVNSSKGYILPKSFRNFSTKWEDGTPSYKQVKDNSGKPVLDASGVPKDNLSYDKLSLNKLRFGKYDARLVMIYNDGKGDVSTTAKLSFWVIPWRIISVIIVIGLLVLAGLWALVGRPLRARVKGNKKYEDRRN